MQAALSEDIENVDPETLHGSAKRKRGLDEDEISSKGSLKAYRLATLPLAENRPAGRETLSKRPSPQISLKPAGRSPTSSKTCKAFSRRSAITKARPELRSKKNVIRPFSIATALSNGKPQAKSPTAPASWFFEIHVDSEQDEMTNLVQHSTCVLDISDSEGKQTRESRGKENVPPREAGVDLGGREQATAAAGARKRDMMEDRSPLTELDAVDFYGADCNAFSCVIVHEESEKAPEKKQGTAHTQLPASQALSGVE